MPDHTLARFRATVHYDGTAFRGWQLQPAVRTVQGTLEETLDRLLTVTTRVHAAGRTDTGVHATGQEIAFDAAGHWEPGDLHRGLNALVPDDVWIEQLSRATPDFHPRFHATARRYEYVVGTGRLAHSPLRRGRLWVVDRSIDRAALETATGCIVGAHSFGAFVKTGQPERGTGCHVEEAGWAAGADGDLRFTIIADRFLHRMVRYLVGTMIEIASGKRIDTEMERLLAEDSSVRPPSPAPAHGLYLTGVRYATGWNRTAGIPGS